MRHRLGPAGFNYADARAMILKSVPDTLIMQRTSYGWTFYTGWKLTPPFVMWYDPDIQENT